MSTHPFVLETIDDRVLFASRDVVLMSANLDARPGVLVWTPYTQAAAADFAMLDDRRFIKPMKAWWVSVDCRDELADRLRHYFRIDLEKLAQEQGRAA